MSPLSCIKEDSSSNNTLKLNVVSRHKDWIMLDVLVNSGKGMFADIDPNGDMPATERIPSLLMQPHLGKGQVLYTGNL